MSLLICYTGQRSLHHIHRQESGQHQSNRNSSPSEAALLNSDDAKLAVSKSFNTDGILKVAALSADDFKLLIGSADGLNIDVLVSLYTSDQGLTPKVKKISFKTSKLVI